MKRILTQEVLKTTIQRISTAVFLISFLLLAGQSAKAQVNYVEFPCADPYVQIQGVAGTTFLGAGDDVIFANVAIPFPFTVYTTSYSLMNVGTNGFIVMMPGGVNRGLGNINLPTAVAGAALYPFWDDLDADGAVVAGSGVYTRVDGVAPNRIFTIEWYRIGHFNMIATTGDITFQVRLFETSNRIQYKYQDVIFAGAHVTFNNGLSATIGIEGPLPAPRPFTLHSFNTAGVVDGQCIEYLLPNPCNPIAGPALTVPNSPGLCVANALVPLPTFNPPGCANGVTVGLRYRLGNVGPFINVPLPASNVLIPNIPGGTSTITWQTYLIANGATLGSATQQITVIDTEDPVVNCPLDIINTLLPGECAAFINFNVTATDNCPFQGPAGTLNAFAGASNNNNSAGGVVFFDLVNNFSGPITITGMSTKIGGPSLINVYIKTGSGLGFEQNAGAWTFVGTGDATAGPFNPALTPFAINFQLPVGTTGVALHVASQSSFYTNGNGINGAYGNSPNGNFTDGTLTILAGATSNTFFASAPFNPRIWNGSVSYFTSSGGNIVQFAGLPSGSLFPIGTTTNCFMVDDAQGNIGTCCFDVTVNEFPNPTTTLACNDNVQVSVNEFCEALITTDMILEGGPYACYDNYLVAVEGYGEAYGGVTIDNEAIGQTLTVTVTDPLTGNSCWGTISVEDKIPPTISCQDVTIMCGAQLPTVPSPEITGYQELLITGLNDIVEVNSFTYDFDFSYLPSTAVLDIDARILLVDHTFLPDLRIDVISPTGQVQSIFNITGCTGQNWPIDTWFDDEGGVITLCADLNAGGAPLQPLQPPGVSTPVLNTFDGDDASGVWQIRIADIFALDDGIIQEVGLRILVNIPQIDPADNCGEVDVTFTDVESGDPCDGLLVTRHWVVTDESGNTAWCDQNITVEPLVLDSVDCPLAVVAHCGDSSDPNDIEDYLGPEYAWPSVNGNPITDEGNICNIFVGYWDKLLNDCGNGEKIVRTWTILDWCTQSTFECVQVLKFTDDEAPELDCPDDFEVGTDFWYCYANVSVPKPAVFDACSSAYTLTMTSTAGIVVNFGNNFVINELPLGTHTVCWFAEDECGNESSCCFEITVVDDVVPVANCDHHTIVALTNDGPFGVTLVPAEVFDDGSYDNCGPVTFRVRRMESCIDFDWTTEGACIDHIPGGIPPVNSRDRGTVHRPCAPFACCDVGADEPIMVELEVTDASGNRNFCMVEVTVQDKISPFIICPPDIIVSCDFWFAVEEGTFEDAEGNANGNLDEDPLSPIFGNMYDAFAYNDDESVRGDIIINDPGNEDFSQPHFWGIEGWADDNCEVNLQVRVRVIDDCSGDELPGNAPDGAVKLIERRFSASDGNDGVAPGTCTQRIWVVDFDPFYIDDTTCNNADPNDGVIWPCDVLLTDCPEDLGDTGEPTIFDDACSMIGVTYEDTRFDFVDGACFKILREWAIIDWCQYGSDGEGGYNGIWYYVQVIKVHDEEGPEFVDCPVGPVVLCVLDDGVSLPDNNQAFLGENDPNASSCSAHLNLCQTVHETCSEFVNYDVKLYPFNGDEFIQVKPTTTIATDSNNNAELCFDTRQSTIQAIRLNGIPYNSMWCGDYHRILWSVEDGCGNWSHCEYLFRLEDCKQPSPVCINGLSTVVMPIGGEVTIWAKDFDASSFDDCTPADELLFSFTEDTYTPSFTYTCDNVPQFGVELTVHIWVADNGTDDNCNGQISWNERNKDFCTTTIVITDNDNIACGDTIGPIVGEILTDAVQTVELASVNLTAPGKVFPTYVTAANGQYHFTNVILPDHYEIKAERDDQHRNGVSTLDLVQIQKHLLGIQPLSNPYDIIAADANNSSNVSAIDLIEIRKLILGLYNKLPDNTSWRFIDKSYQFADPLQPWHFDEIIDYTDINGNTDFVAVKIGDVNNSVQANALQILPRNGNGIVRFNAEDRTVVAGERVDVAIRSNDFAGIEGYQFTLETQGLEFRSVESGAIEMTEDNMGVFGSTMTASWHKVGGVEVTSSDVLFTLHFQATTGGQLSDMINLNSKETVAEAYNAAEEIKDLKLNFRGLEQASEFALYQNEPNPFKGNTVIGYEMPEAGNVILSVFDITGKVLVVKEAAAVKGYNTITVSNKELPAIGVLYYRLDANEYTATKKMIIIE